MPQRIPRRVTVDITTGRVNVDDWQDLDQVVDDIVAGATDGMREAMQDALVNSPYWPIRSGLSLLSFYVALGADGDNHYFLISNSARSASGRPRPYARFVESRTRAAELTILDHLAEIAEAGRRGAIAGYRRGGRGLVTRVFSEAVSIAEDVDRELAEGRDG